jgi:DNA-binding MarR family transcriptional regulator
MAARFDMPKARAESGLDREPAAAGVARQLRRSRRSERVARATEPDLRRLTGCLHSLSSRHHELIQGYAARAGIACMQFTILTTIRHLAAGGDVFLVTIADHLRLTSAGVTKAIQHLTELGLVEKTGDRDDRRRARLTVTRRGCALLDSLAPMQSKVNDVWLDCMNESELSIFLDLAERFIKSSDRALALQSYLGKDSDAVPV